MVAMLDITTVINVITLTVNRSRGGTAVGNFLPLLFVHCTDKCGFVTPFAPLPFGVRFRKLPLPNGIAAFEVNAVFAGPVSGWATIRSEVRNP